MREKDFVCPTLEGHIVYGLQPGVPEPDVTMASSTFIGPLWVAPSPEALGVGQSAARWLHRHRGAMRELADL